MSYIRGGTNLYQRRVPMAFKNGSKKKDACHSLLDISKIGSNKQRRQTDHPAAVLMALARISRKRVQTHAIADLFRLEAILL
jgi:hypothetical protein